MAAKRPYSSFFPVAAGAAAAYMARRVRPRRGPKSGRSAGRRRTGGRRSSRLPIRKRNRMRVRRRNVFDNTQGHRELGKVSVRYGRRAKKNLKTLWKTVKAAEEKVFLGNQQLSEFGGGSGAQYFNNAGNNGSLQAYANVRLFSVTGTMNVDTSGNLIQNPVMWYPTFTNETDTGVNDWTPVDVFQLLGSPAQVTNIVSYPLATSNLRWYRLKLMLYNAVNFPGKYRIELIQLRDERLHPTSPSSQFRTAFWQSIIKQWTYNPCAEADTKMNKYFKVMKRLNVYMDSKDTDQTVNTNYKEVNFFCRLNRTCRYDWNQDDRMNMQNNDQQINNADNLTDVHPNARLYVLVRALAKRVAVPPGFDVNVNPSFDYSVKVCHSKLD
jgi:hypothetical protein